MIGQIYSPRTPGSKYQGIVCTYQARRVQEYVTRHTPFPHNSFKHAGDNPILHTEMVDLEDDYHSHTFKPILP